jgi:cytoskeletal protein CcmA (bactofilin family)
MATNPAGGTVGEGAVLSGKVRGRDLAVLGVVEGEVHLEGRLVVGAGGRVAARVRAAEVVVDGTIEGEVQAASLTLGETARARGTFLAQRLVVKEGALVEGAINPGAAGREAAAAEPLAPLGEAAATTEPADDLTKAGSLPGAVGERPE